MRNKESLVALNSLFIRINKERKRITQQYAEPLGLTMSQVMVLQAANDHPGSIQKELSCETGIATTVLVGILTKMETAGLLYRQSCADNRRIYQIYVTEKGKHYIEKIDQVTVSVMSEMMGGFSEEEMGVLYGFLQRIHGNCLTSPRNAGEE